MRIILSPAKKMNVDTDNLAHHALPQFLPEAQRIKQVLQGMSPAHLQALWNCNDAIAALNMHWLHTVDLEKNLTPAILAYEGIQYQYMAPGVFEEAHFDYIEKHLRILSGFYGLLRPFDGVAPYRLEMQARLSVNGCKDLYAFWGSRLAAQLCRETDFILNLASKEYSKAVIPHLAGRVRLLTCTFGQWQNEKLVEKGTHCKMTRGQMVRFLAENNIVTAEEITSFNQLGYAFSPPHSTRDHFVFIKDAPKSAR